MGLEPRYTYLAIPISGCGLNRRGTDDDNVMCPAKKGGPRVHLFQDNYHLNWALGRARVKGEKGKVLGQASEFVDVSCV
jgi:hypothetical protein